MNKQVAALLHFRLPEVSVVTQQQPQAQPQASNPEGEGGNASNASSGSGGGGGSSGGGKSGEVVVVHHSFEKEPSALPVHHVPICVSFGLFHEVNLCIYMYICT